MIQAQELSILGATLSFLSMSMLSIIDKRVKRRLKNEPCQINKSEKRVQNMILDSARERESFSWHL
jgi:hypothetical protein